MNRIVKSNIANLTAILLSFVLLSSCFLASCNSDIGEKESSSELTDKATENSSVDSESKETVNGSDTVGSETSEHDSDKTDSTETEPVETEDISEIFEKEYVDPLSVNISDNDGNAKNLICIYLESMETTYASKAVGGAQADINYIPNLTLLAQNNITFSDGDGLGGFVSVAGTGWTMGALLGTTSGIPFLLAETGENSHNSLGKDGTFLNGLTNIGDILASKGYTQEFLCGSQASFGGRKTYFEVHGQYEIYDLFDARRDDYIPKDYFVWWGYEDYILYDIAKDEITSLAEGDKPFNFTMLTVDTHHVGGFVCSECGSNYTTGLENVVSCADRQLFEFIEWCKAQDFYDNTTIVIIGDHPRMDSQLVKGVDFYDRTMYNCFINSAVTPESETKNRVFTSLDMFPSVLSAMGFEIEGERLGLGTNIFSSVPTLAEKHGLERFEYAISQPSEYYRENFMKSE